MEMGAPKTKIACNFKKDSAEFKLTSEFQFRLGPSIIDPVNIIDKKSTVRLLGVHWALSGKSNPTVNHALEEVKQQLATIRRHYAPGMITLEIINTVIIPTLRYRLQLTFISETACKSINSRLRGLLKRNMHVNPTASTSPFYDPEMGIKLSELRNMLERGLLSNIQCLIKDTGLSGQVLRAALKQHKEKKHLTNDAIYYPQHYTDQNYLLQYISSVLFKHKAAIRPIINTKSDSVFDHFPPHHLTLELKNKLNKYI
jgi:hypothetical protein